MEGEKIERNCVCKEGKGEKLYMEGEKNESGNCMESIKKKERNCVWRVRKRERLCMEGEKKKKCIRWERKSVGNCVWGEREKRNYMKNDRKREGE